MKNRASVFLKQIISILTTLAKEKSMALKSKTNAIKTRLIIFSLVKNKKVLMGSISDKIQALLHHHTQEDRTTTRVVEEQQDRSKAIVLLYNESNPELSHTHEEFVKELEEEEELDEDDKYPDLTHSLFGNFEDDIGTSVIDLVRKSKVGGGEEFRLEDEIDQVADLFISRFHRQLRLQKQHSVKRYQEMLQNSTV